MSIALSLDYQALRDQLIPTHGVIGLLAILAGVVALVVPKRAPLHVWAGRLFMVSMCVAMSLAAPVIATGRNLFLFGVGLLVAYHIFVAWRLARLKPPTSLPKAIDRWIHPLFGLIFVAFASYGVLMLIAGGGMGVVVVVLSGVGLAAVRHFFRFMTQEAFEDGAWIGEHIRGVAAAFIASITAFTAAAGPRIAPQLPAPLLWLGPTVIFTPLFIYFGQEVQKQRRLEREQREQAELLEQGASAAEP